MSSVSLINCYHGEGLGERGITWSNIENSMWEKGSYIFMVFVFFMVSSRHLFHLNANPITAAIMASSDMLILVAAIVAAIRLSFS